MSSTYSQSCNTDCHDCPCVLNTTCAKREQESKSVDTQDDAMSCRENIEAGEGEGYQGKHAFQDQALVNIYKKIYLGTHAEKQLCLLESQIICLFNPQAKE